VLLDIYIFFWVTVLVVGLPLALVAWRSRSRPGDTKLVFLGVSGGESSYYTSPYAYEVRVRPKDEQRAREVLGL